MAGDIMTRTGRRPGQTKTRERILATARAQFARRGHDRTTVRDIAKSAGVDPALVLHFFGSKDELFQEAVRLPFDPTDVMAPLFAQGLDGLGERVTRQFVQVWDSPSGARLLALFRSFVGSERSATLMRGFMTHKLFPHVARALGGADSERRTSLVAGQLFGLALTRYVLKLEPIASATPEELATWIGPTLQRYFTGAL